MNITSDEDSDDYAVGLGSYPESLCKASVFQAQAPVVGSGAEALVLPLTAGQPGSSRSPTWSTANQTFNTDHPSAASDVFGLTASMHFPTQFDFTTPTSGETVSLREMTSLGDSFISGTAYQDGTTRGYGTRGWYQYLGWVYTPLYKIDRIFSFVPMWLCGGGGVPRLA